VIGSKPTCVNVNPNAHYQYQKVYGSAVCPAEPQTGQPQANKSNAHRVMSMSKPTSYISKAHNCYEAEKSKEPTTHKANGTKPTQSQRRENFI
jgi:hypothetical protein